MTYLTRQIYTMLIKTTTGILFFIVIVTTHATAGNFDTVFRFLQSPASPYTASLGGNVISLPETDVNAFMINPAYLNERQHRHIGVSYMNYITDINSGVASGAYHIPDYGTFALGIKYMDYGDFTRTDQYGENLGSFRAYDFAATIGWGYSVSDRLHSGVTLHTLLSSYDNYSSSAVAGSAGMHYTINDHTHAGITLNHLGRQITFFDEEQEPLPLDLRAGISRKLTHLPLRLNLTIHSLNRWNQRLHHDAGNPGFTSNLFRHVAFGGEFIFTENVQLRIGYDHRQHEELKADNRIDLAGIRVGLGVHVNRFRFDVSHNSYSDIGGLTQLAVQMRL